MSRIPQGRAALRAYGAVVGISVLIRLCALWFSRNAAFVSDGQDYVSMARRLWSGEHFLPYWPPGLPLYLAPFAGISNGSIVAIRAAMLLFWLLGCWGLYRLARALDLAQFAWVVLAVFSVMPSAIQMSIEPVTQQPMAALLLIALSAAVFAGRKGGPGEYVLLGVSLGLLVLTRPSALPFILVLPLACWWYGRREKGGKVIAGPVLSVVLGGALVFAWMARTYVTSGAWIINSSNGINIFYGNNQWTPLYRTWYFGSHAKPGTEEVRRLPEYAAMVDEANKLPAAEQSREYQMLALRSIESRPELFVLRTFNRVQCFFGFDTFTSANLSSRGGWARRLFPLSLAMEALLYMLVATPAFFWIAAAGGEFWKRWETWLIGGAIVLYAAPYWLSMSHPTYHYPIVAPLAILGLLAWRVSAARPTRSLYATLRGWSAVAVLVVIQAVWLWEMSLSIAQQGR